jgi:hypothetical protein
MQFDFPKQYIRMMTRRETLQHREKVTILVVPILLHGEHQ